MKDFDHKDLGVYDLVTLPKKAKNRILLPPEVLQKMQEEAQKAGQEVEEVQVEEEEVEESWDEVSDGESWASEEAEEQERHQDTQ